LASFSNKEITQSEFLDLFTELFQNFVQSLKDVGASFDKIKPQIALIDNSGLMNLTCNKPALWNTRPRAFVKDSLMQILKKLKLS